VLLQKSVFRNLLTKPSLILQTRDRADMTDSSSVELNNPDLLRDRAFVGGAWIDGIGRIDVTNPADGTKVGTIPDVGSEGAEKAVAVAHEAQKPWAARTAKERSVILRRWYELIMANQDDLARILTAEQGKPLVEARGEVAYAAAFIEWFSEEARRIDGEIITSHAADKRIMVIKRPVGVVAAITPWNFPLAMITRKAGPALAVGCTMVLKPAELTPLSALALAYLGEQAGLPAGTFNVITGKSRPIGAVLTSDPRVRKFTFTGSTEVGKILAAQCTTTVKRVSLELGGNAPFIVFDDANVDAAVEGAIASKFRNTGQTCVCANRLIVQAGVYDEFAKKLADRVSKMVVGAGLLGPTDQGPLIDRAAVNKSREHVDDAVSRGARILAGGTALEGPGSFFTPTVMVDVPADALLCQEETFGPVAGLVRFETEAEAIYLANDTTAGLASYVFTRNASRQWRMAEALEYGMVGMNTGLISTEVAPFGGVKESGQGREGSRHGVEDYLDMRMICTQIELDDAD
jgi:succinate-semialdehyde dehydrogenase/glutarate-semialdehyde dehydrogenase